MTAVVGTCPTCGGAGDVPHPSYPGSYGCTYCDGSGVRKRRGYGGYKTAAGAARALAEGTGVRCSSCAGTGRIAFPERYPCSCDHGRVLLEIHPGDVIPEEVDLFGSLRGSALETYAAEVDVVVTVQDRPGTWMEAHLGIGSVVSATDYGRAWDDLVADRDAAAARLIAEARAHLKGTQFVKLADRTDRVIAGELHVVVHRNGYNVVTVASAASAGDAIAALPPTYTEDVLFRPQGR